jgi:hypothetical protein
MSDDNHEHNHQWTTWQEGPPGVTHVMEYRDYVCACGDVKGRDTRNGRKLTEDERD